MALNIKSTSVTLKLIIGLSNILYYEFIDTFKIIQDFEMLKIYSKGIELQINSTPAISRYKNPEIYPQFYKNIM